MKVEYHPSMSIDEIRHYVEARLLEGDLEEALIRVVKHGDTRVREAYDSGYQDGRESGLEDAESDYQLWYNHGYHDGQNS